MSDEEVADKLSASLLCPKCHAIKPRADFKRILSRAQARQVGYSGERRVQITSTLCKECRPRRKPAAKLTRKQLINRIQGGDIHPVVGQAMLEQREQKAKAKMSRAITLAWEKARRMTWDLPLEELQQENRRFQAVRNYRRSCGDAASVALCRFSNIYINLLGNIQSAIHARRRLAADCVTQGFRTPIAPYTDWQDYAEQEVLERLIQSWECVPDEARRRLRHQPALLTFRPEHRRAPPSAPTRPATTGKEGTQVNP